MNTQSNPCVPIKKTLLFFYGFYVTKIVKKEEPKSLNNNNYLVDRYLYSVTTALVCCKGHFFKEKGGLCTISCDYNRPIVASLSPVRASLRSVV